jgi:lipoprotein signal peptidase
MSNTNDKRATRCVSILIATALSVFVIDLLTKMLLPTAAQAYHIRSFRQLVAMIVISAISAIAFSRAGSRMLALAGGLMIGGGFGNAFSSALTGRGIPNPFSIHAVGQTIAFNAADVGVGLGVILLAFGVVITIITRRGELEQPMAPVHLPPAEGRHS